MLKLEHHRDRSCRPLPVYQVTPFDLASRQAEWDYYYDTLDIGAERADRLADDDYRGVVDRAMTRSQIGRALELACGSAPWAVYLRDHGYTVDCADYSSVVVNRLRDEGLSATQCSLHNLSAFQTSSYDVIVMAGGIGEDPDPMYGQRVYQEIARLLRPGGVFVQFLNRHRNRKNVLHATRAYAAMVARWPFFYVPWVRRVLNKRPIHLAISYWLLPVELVTAWGTEAGLTPVACDYLHGHDQRWSRAAGLTFVSVPTRALGVSTRAASPD